jgi:predicted permease
MELTEPVPEGMKLWLLIVIIAVASFAFLALIGYICMKMKNKTPSENKKISPGLTPQK